MEINIKRSTLDEIDTLLSIQRIAFAEDLEKYEDIETSPVNETQKKLIENVSLYLHYTIWSDNKVIGGIDIRKLDEKSLRISKIFLDKEYQNKGIGSKIIGIVEAEFPSIEVWSLYTPYLNLRNHHFYEKLGYIKIGEVQVTEKLMLFKYNKLIAH